MSVRKRMVAEALNNFPRLNELLLQLTEEEVLACLEFESRSTRRKTVINRLIQRAAQLNKERYVTQLSRKFHHGQAEHQEHDLR